MLLISVTEITRDGSKVGHFNALFTTDNNLVYDPDPVQAVREALEAKRTLAYGYGAVCGDEQLHMQRLCIIIGCSSHGHEHVFFKREPSCCKLEIPIAKDTII